LKKLIYRFWFWYWYLSAIDQKGDILFMNKYEPGFLHKTALNFAGVSDSNIYKMIESGEYEYFIFIFRKNKLQINSGNG